MEKAYRIISMVEPSSRFQAGLTHPTVVYTFVSEDGQMVRAKLPRRSDWGVGRIVKIEEDVIHDNLVD